MSFKLLTPQGFELSDVSGQFAGWAPGKIYGRLDCKSGMRMLKKNRVFFLNREDAISCGYRTCKRCKP